MAYPTNLDTDGELPSDYVEGQPFPAAIANNMNSAIKKLEAKNGIGSGTAAAAAVGTILSRKAGGETDYQTLEALGGTPKNQTMGSVVHGTNANAARPSGFAQVTWTGTVDPVNRITNDIWNDTSA